MFGLYDIKGIVQSVLSALGMKPTTVVASQAAMLALADDPGQKAIRTDLTPDQVYVQTTSPATLLANWQIATADVASEVTFVPDGDIAATNTQAAVVEVRDDAASALSTHAGVAAAEGASAHIAIATQAYANAGTNDATALTPKKAADSYIGAAAKLHLYATQ